MPRYRQWSVALVYSTDKAPTADAYLDSPLGLPYPLHYAHTSRAALRPSCALCQHALAPSKLTRTALKESFFYHALSTDHHPGDTYGSGRVGARVGTWGFPSKGTWFLTSYQLQTPMGYVRRARGAIRTSSAV